MDYFKKRRDYAAIFIRLIVGFHLIYGTQDNVFSYARMLEFKEFLDARGVPFPLYAAHLSVYAQFVCGILYILGAATRYAAVVMIVNFIAALIIAHRNDPYPPMFPALMMLSASLFFLFHGAGRPSIDALWERRGRR
ncbi:MAG TPA: DoxX family protein [Blastocatellia bacterium]|nr:DoxX family protein [Blastocatellia bacterium]